MRPYAILALVFTALDYLITALGVSQTGLGGEGNPLVTNLMAQHGVALALGMLFLGTTVVVSVGAYMGSILPRTAWAFKFGLVYLMVVHGYGFMSWIAYFSH